MTIVAPRSEAAEARREAAEAAREAVQKAGEAARKIGEAGSAAVEAAVRTAAEKAASELAKDSSDDSVAGGLHQAPNEDRGGDGRPAETVRDARQAAEQAAHRIAEATRELMPFADAQGKRVVSYLPMAHIAERTVSHYSSLVLGYEVTCCPEPGQIGNFHRQRAGRRFVVAASC